MRDVGDPAGANPRPPIRRVLVFVTVALALMMMSIDGTIVATALHAIEGGLDTSINWAGWTLTAYSFGFVVMLPVSGKLSERYGRRRVFIASVVAFTLASLCCGLTDNIYALIALRAVQAAGGAGFTPSATGIVVDHFGDWRDRAVSLFGSIFPIGYMIGPIFGGLFVKYWTWRGVFFINVPIGLAVIALAWRYVPHDHAYMAKARAPMDLRGLALLGCGLIAGMLAVSYLGEHSARAWSPLFLVPAVIAAGALWGFLRHVGHAARPFIAPRFIHGEGFGAVNVVNLVYGGVTSGCSVLIPLYAVNRYGLDVLASGTLLIAQGAATIVASVVAALALRRTGHRPPLYAGGAVIALGLLLLALGAQGSVSPYAWLAGAAFVVGIGRGAINPASRNAGLQLAPASSSTLAALRTMCGQTGSITTISIATAILAGALHPGSAQALIYVAAAALLLVALPLVARVPEHHGTW
ncbi:MAG TPA: MFS transporter [Rhodanobacteraceae bacterium]|nr:MFS transporter [Rhodanobacteraceae bacterium]